LRNRWKPSIQHDQEQAIPIRDLDATPQPSAAPQSVDVGAPRSLPQVRFFDLNGEADRGQEEAEERDHRR